MPITAPLRASPRGWRPTSRPCAPLPCGAATPRYPPARASKKPCQSAFFENSERRLSCFLRPAPLSTSPPRAGNRTVFMRSFDEAPHTQQATTAIAEPVASHKNEFCLLRPPGARSALSALRLISPHCARPPLLGASALVGPATARAARHVAGPSWSPHSRRKVHHPRIARQVLFASQKAPKPAAPGPPGTPRAGKAVTLCANHPKRMRTLLVFAAGRKWGGKNKKCFEKRDVQGRKLRS